MDRTPLVSVITLTFNHQNFIGQCIESVLSQTFPLWEQIVIDDGSSDATPDLIRRYPDPRIRYVRQENRGIFRIAETYNRALSLCRGSLIAILEGDDYWPPDKLQHLLPALEDESVVLAYGHAKVVRETKARVPSTIPHPKFLSRASPSVLTNDPVGRAALAMLDARWLTFLYPCTVVLRRAALERISGFQYRRGFPVTDYPTFLRLCLEGRFHYTPRIVGYWRVHSAGTTVSRLHSILRGAEREMLRFRRKHGLRLGFSASEWMEIDRSWRTVRAMRRVREGRRLLLHARWDGARRKFLRAIVEGSTRIRLVAAAGMAAAALKTPIEGAFRTARRPWYRRRTDGGLELVGAAANAQVSLAHERRSAAIDTANRR